MAGPNDFHFEAGRLMAGLNPEPPRPAVKVDGRTKAAREAKATAPADEPTQDAEA